MRESERETERGKERERRGEGRKEETEGGVGGGGGVKFWYMAMLQSDQLVRFQTNAAAEANPPSECLRHC